MNFLYQLFSEDLIYALGWTVLHSFWQALAVGLLMAVGMMLLQQKSAKARYELAAFSLFLVFISSIITFLVYYDTAQVTTTFVTTGLQTTGTAAALSETTTVTTSPLENYLQYFNQNIPFVVAVWFLGVCFFLLRLMGGLAYIQRLKYTNNKPASAEWTARVEQLCKKLRLHKSVKLVESSLATVPMVIGYFKPIILMPIGTINGLSESEVDAILAHELAHVYRNDFLINIFLSVIEVLFYFNPAVWWISANVRTERENCCDDIAIKLCGNSLIYAKALLSLQELSQSVPGYAMGFAGPKNQLLHRVKRILSQPRTKSNMLEKFTATCLLMITMVLFSIGANSYNYNKNIQQQFFANEMNALMSAEHGDEAGFYDLTAKNDTTPKSKKQRYIKKSDGGEVELEIEEGDISKLVINGNEIPESELGQYDELVDNLIEEMESVPGQNHITNHTRNSSTSVFDHRNKKTITTETEENGHTRIVIQSNGEEPTEIILNDGQEFIFIDGTRLEGGDTAVIIDEKSRVSILGSPNDPAAIHRSRSLSDIDKLNKEIEKALSHSNVSMDEVIQKRIAEMEKKLQELRIRQEELQVRNQRIQEEQIEKQMEKHEEQMKEHRLRMNEQQLEWTGRRNASDQQVAAMRDRQRVLINEANEMAKLQEAEVLTRQLQEDENPTIRFDDQIKNTLLQEMIKDGLIADKNDYSFELTQQYFKVNGKKQSDSVAKKYLRLYEKQSGHPLHSNGQIKYKNKNGNTQSSFRSSGIFKINDFQQYSYYFLVQPEIFRLTMEIPKRIDGLETLSFFITPIEFKSNLFKLT